MLDELKQRMSEGIVEGAKQQVWIILIGSILTWRILVWSILIWSIIIVEITLLPCLGCWPLGLREEGEGGGVGR